MTDQAPAAPAATSEAIAPSGTTSAAVAAPAPAAPPAAAGPEWLKGADELKVGYVQNKGWSDPSAVVDSYMNLEKMMGADKAGRTVVMPGEKAEAAELDAFYAKLGRPTEAKDYKVDVPQGSPPEYADGFRSKAHELGLTSKQVEGLAAWNNEFAGTLSASQQNQSVEQFNRDVTAVRQEWGAAHDQNLVVARNAAAALGWDATKIDKVSGALGHKATMDMLYQIGSKTGESDFVTGTGTSFGGAKTPAQAKAEIQALRSDKGFMTKWMNKDAESLAKWSQLHQYAFPESK